MKSGTTSIQALLFDQRQALADRGVLALGSRWTDQVQGVRELIASPEAPGRSWLRLVEQAQGWPGSSVISMEFLGPFIPRRVKAAVASFGDLPVHVVITARDLNRSVPSLWQEAVQNGRAWSWADYRADAKDARPWQTPSPVMPSGPGRTFWRQQDAHRIVSRWADVVGPSRVTVVTLPPPGAPSRTLTERFGQAVGFVTDDLVVPEPKNTTLGAASVQLLQRLNTRLAERGLGGTDARSLRKGVLAKRVLSSRRGEEQRIGLEVQPWLAETSAQMVERLRGTGVNLVGDWADLAPVPVAGVDPAETPGAELVAAARCGFEGLYKRLRQRRVTVMLPNWPTAPGPSEAVDALADLVVAGATSKVRT
ncbi:hypothetical protein [Nocardioides ungokensis]|uniref:hypothetical protein n=1 Tax=Nocardioides ungokensis TaxID=1643322 RepID=UPI0015DEE1B3|nr:hypothetical protein [Nocardioides ungokensis]